MSSILIIQTEPASPLTNELIEAQEADSSISVKVVSLHDTSPNYTELVDALFAAESIQVF